jgi:DNA-binding beta-propeller fold protein YncE/mono/diheme cytochrome c family protein
MIGCGTGLDDPRFPTGSSTVAAGPGETLFVVDTAGGTVARVDVSTGDVSSVAVGGEPTRLAVLGDRVIVSLRTDGALAVLVADGESLRLEDTVPVGVEPLGLVAAEDGSRLYVALSMEDRVVELDGDLTLLRSWTVPFEPRWPALHPSGEALYIGSTFDGAVAWIDLREEDAVRRVDLPELRGRDLETGRRIALTQRVTGDLSVASAGDLLAVPMLYVDNISEVGEPDLTSVSDRGYDANAENDRVAGRFSPVAVLVPLDRHGAPTGEPTGVSLAVLPDGAPALRSYPSSVTFSPDGEVLLATQEASGVVVAVPARRARDEAGETLPRRRDEIGAERRSLIPVATDSGPRGVAFIAEDRAFVHSFLSRKIADIRFGTIDRLLPRDDRSTDTWLSAHDGIRVADDTLPLEVRVGRRLFYGADDSRVAGPGSGVSCSTCHFDGRTDGLTWALVGLPRQTPSLAGAVSLTAPVTWSDGVETVQEEVFITSQGRMGGRRMTSGESAAVASFIEWTRLPLLPEENAEAVEAGRRIFEREEVGCSECHTGPAYTDNEPYEMFGELTVRTRSLLGIGATAPYLHDGSASSLGELIERIQDGSMGDTSSLDPEEMNQLEAFLRSL